MRRPALVKDSITGNPAAALNRTGWNDSIASQTRGPVRAAARENPENRMIIIDPLFRIAQIAIELYIWLIIIGAILSWLIAFNVVNTSNRFVYVVGDFLYRLTEPALRPIRRILPNLGGIDLSPVVLILGLFFLQMVLGNIHLALLRA
jgi:YggT family protein